MVRKKVVAMLLAGGLLYLDGGEAGAGLAVYQYGQNARARPQVETAFPPSGPCKVSQQHRVAAVCEARLVHYYGQAVALQIFSDFHGYIVPSVDKSTQALKACFGTLLRSRRLYYWLYFK